MNSSIIKKSILSVALCVFGFMTQPVLPAQADALGSGSLKTADLGIPKETDFRKVVIQIIKVVLSFVALIAVIMIVIGGIVWMTSAGNSERVETAKKIIYSAIIGLIVILSSYSIVAFISKQLA